MVFRTSTVLIALLVGTAVSMPEQFNAVMQAVLAQIIQNAGWVYLLIVFLTLLFRLFLAFGHLGKLRIGGEEAEPEFSSWTWLSMMFAAGMSIGLVFWGAAEPLSHFSSPPEGIAPQTSDAARAGMRYAFFHWGLHPWAIYALLGLAMVWFQFNRNGKGLISDILSPVIGEHHKGLIGHCVNIAAVVATAIGVATTLGFGTIQIAAGIVRVFGWTASTGSQLTIIAVAFVAYMASSTSGVERGIKWLSTVNLILAGLLALSVLIMAPTSFILETFTTTLGSYINELVTMSLRLSPFSENPWAGDWTIFYWAWWIAWAPFVGAFIARVSLGRTVKEFVLGVVFAPSLLGFVWFAIFGGAALQAEIFGQAELLTALSQGYETVSFVLLIACPARFYCLRWLCCCCLFINHLKTGNVIRR